MWPDGPRVAEFGLFIYAMGALTVLAGLLSSLWRVWRWTAQAMPVKEPYPCDLINRLSAEMRITSRVRTVWSRQVGGPLSWGLWPPTILLPRDRYRDDDVKLEYVMAHELAHLSRGDWLWHLLAQAVNALCWWNPLVTMVVRRHAEQTEQACDRLAVSHCGSVQSYARSLLAAAGGTNEVVAMSMAESSGLGRRIESLINLETRRTEMKSIHKLLCAVAMTVIVLPLAACSLTQAAESVPVADSPVAVVTPTVAPVANRVAEPSGAVAAAPVVVSVPVSTPIGQKGPAVPPTPPVGIPGETHVGTGCPGSCCASERR